MHADATDPATPNSSGSATRARILAAASELFYGQGIRATSADRIIEQVGITKVTFYRHFRTKSELVVAYLKEQAAAERGWSLPIPVTLCEARSRSTVRGCSVSSPTSPTSPRRPGRTTPGPPRGS